MNISMPRGDIKWQRFIVKTPNGTASDIDFTSIYFTVKRHPRDKDFLFQKSLKDGTIYKIGLGDYEFKIDSEDTKALTVGNYVFDIQVGYKNLIKETADGIFTLEREVTWYDNEQYEDPQTGYILPEASGEPAVVMVIPDYLEIQLEDQVIVTENTDYNYLQNIPSINGVKLIGNLTSADLYIEGGGGSPDIPEIYDARPFIDALVGPDIVIGGE